MHTALLVALDLREYPQRRSLKHDVVGRIRRGVEVGEIDIKLAVTIEIAYSYTHTGQGDSRTAGSRYIGKDPTSIAIRSVVAIKDIGAVVRALVVAHIQIGTTVQVVVEKHCRQTTCSDLAGVEELRDFSEAQVLVVVEEVIAGVTAGTIGMNGDI